MSKVVELFGQSAAKPGVDWKTVVTGQQCVFANKKCYKIRKSDPDTAIGSCTVLYGREPEPVIICPTRLIERRQIFTDCFHLLTTHEPGNELHIVSEVSIPGGSVDYSHLIGYPDVFIVRHIEFLEDGRTKSHVLHDAGETSMSSERDTSGRFCS